MQTSDGSAGPQAPMISVTIPYLEDPETLKRCLDCLGASTVLPTQVIIVDNGSGAPIDGLVPPHLPVKVVRNSGNVGFARAVNQGFAEASGDLLLVLNADAFVDPKYIEYLIGAMSEPSVAGATGKLLKESDPSTIDSTGHMIWGDRRVSDRGEWERDAGQYDQLPNVFGFPATAALFRMDALTQAAAAASELFDESFFSYGEDVDLAWRLRLLGWNLRYEPKATALHRRAISAARRPTRKLAWDLRNRHLYIVKNDSWAGFRRHIGEFLLLELRLTGYLLLHRPAVIPMAWWGFFLRLPRAMRKRKAIQATRRVDPEALEGWFGRYDYSATFGRWRDP